MKILGIHLRTHDTSVVFIEDGKVVYGASNERFSRVKMDRNAPIGALKNFLEYTKIKPKDIDIVTYVEDPFPKSLLLNFKENSWPITSTRGEYLLWLKKPSLIIAEMLIAPGILSYLYRYIYARLKVRGLLKGFKGKTYLDHHHMAHLHSAYYTSGWKDCLVMANEGSGFPQTLSIYHVNNGVWEKIIENKLPNSMGKFYELVTEILGFNRHRHPGKITGLSAYGNSKIAYGFVKKLMWVKNDKLILNHRMYLKILAYYLNNKKIPPELKNYKREDISAAFQKRLEDCICELVSYAAKKTGENKIALAGGVAANVKANQKIYELPEIKEIFIHQAMGDDGLATGAAMHAAYLNGENIKKPSNVYLGPDFSNVQIEKTLKKFSLRYKKVTNIEKKVAEILSDGKVVARFEGRMEYGPRALGNRSILFHTKDKSVNDWLNKKLKRTEFMPFAPVTLEEYANNCYKNLDGAMHAAKFMTLTFECTPYMKKVSPACVHVDNTARPQIITKTDNPKYYKLLSEYFKLTGIPSLVNTSFNMHEEPIVCTPDDAVRAFLSSQIDYLSIGDFLISIDQNIKVSENFIMNLEIKNKNKSNSNFINFLNH